MVVLKKAYPPCPDKKHDCFACNVRYSAISLEPNLTCKILTEGIENCPFYKTFDEYKRGVKHNEIRNNEAGN